MSEGIQKNLVEQQLNGLSKEKYMLKWGKHQMRQIVRGLNLQYKVNFRDPAVQSFGGDLFNDFADTADDIYNNMPPPVPSVKGKEKEAALKKEEEKKAGEVQENFAQQYNNVESAIGGGGGCFTGYSMVLMGDKTVKKVKDIKRGEYILTQGN